MKKLLSLAGLFGVVASLHSATLPVTGSLFASRLVEGTNAIWVKPGTSTTAFTTNFVSTNVTTLEVTGAGALALETRVIGVSAGGTTNGGSIYLNFAASLDGVTYTTQTNSLQTSLAPDGTVYVIAHTNVPASALGGAAYLRLLSISHTNIGGWWLSNVTYRYLQTK